MSEEKEYSILTKEGLRGLAIRKAIFKACEAPVFKVDRVFLKALEAEGYVIMKNPGLGGAKESTCG